MSGSHTAIRRVLVMGATGYIGGRLVPRLLEAGYHVRCLARSPRKLDAQPWRGQVEVVPGDVLEAAEVRAAMEDVDAVHYLVHSLGGRGDFEERDRTGAEHVRDAAAEAGVSRIVYLGGLGRAADDDELSKHLRSRQEVGQVLAAGTVPVTELRAAVIIGSGSASFEMLRNLVEVLPVMTTPTWVRTRCQPIAIRDVLHYLVRVLEVPATAGRVFEIGGPDVLTYEQMMRIYAQEAGLRRRIILPVPVLSPGLSSLWIGLVTPLPARLGRPLVDSLVNEVVVRENPITEVLDHDPLPFRRAVELALARVRDLEVTTRWSDAELRGRSPADPMPTDPEWAGGRLLVDERTVHADAPVEELYRVVTGIGGERGYFSPDWMWELRGLLDQAVGGVGLRRGRRHPDEVRVGDALDFWRVEAVEPHRLLRLRAEMRLPGEAWLEFRIEPEDGGSRLRQRARFHPRGLLGRLYWYLLVPFHVIVFRQMARRIAATAAAGSRSRAR